MSFLVYKSSAGSGKTFTLVKEYLSLVLMSPEKFKSILAVTFTNKAANEMKERVIDTLSQLCDPDADVSDTLKAMIENLTEATKLPEDRIRSRAQIALDNILHNYNEFAISTIDSFVHRIVRTFALDLKLPYNFEVDLDTDALISNVTQLLISKIGHNKEITKALVRFSETKAEAEKSWNIEKDISDFCKIILKEDSAEALTYLKSKNTSDILNIEQQLLKFINSFESSLKILGAKAIDIIDSNHLEIKDIYYGNAGIAGYFNRLSKGRNDKYIPTKTVKGTLDRDDWTAGKSNQQTKITVNSIKDELTDIYHKVENILESHPKYILYKLIRKSIFPIAILKEIENTIEEYKEADNLLHISEFNKRISQIVSNEPIPFIYERIGEKYQHYLIDEFQDTSIMQWHNLIPLFENSLAQGKKNMLVGDAKQAIYRWRGGELEQFDKLPEVISSDSSHVLKEREKVLKQSFTLSNLQTNYRSKPEIIHFNNRFFSFIAGNLPESLKDIYKDIEQESLPDKQGGYVEINILDNNDYRSSTLSKIEEHIIDCISNNVKLKDIAILCRKNDDASEIARFLLNKGIKIVSSESLLLSKSDEVNLIISIIRLLQNPSDVLSRAIIAKFNYENSSKKNDLHSYLKYHLDQDQNSKPDEIQFNIDRVYEKSDLWKSMALYDMIEDIIREIGLGNTFNPFVSFLADKVLEAFSKRKYNLNDFLAWWDKKKNNFSIILPEGLNAVNILTIHKSKGLEYPVVIFPFADLNTKRLGINECWIDLNIPEIPDLKRTLIPMSKDIEQTSFEPIYTHERSKTLLDMVNLLYVAMTRAKDQLYIIQKRKADQNGLTNANNFIQGFLKEEGKYDELESKFSFGTISPPLKEKKTSENNIIELDNFNSVDWKNRIILSGKSKARDFEKALEKKEWGNIFHDLLSKIKDVSDFQKVKSNIETDILLSDDLKASIISKLDILANNEHFVKLLDTSWKSLNEKDIILDVNNILRPDKVLIKGKLARILEYKTGIENDAHKHQLRKYSQALERMGFTIESSNLVYINEDVRIVQI